MSVRSACSKGFRAYLAEQRQITMKASLSKGLVAGGLASGLFAIINRVAKLDADWYEVLAPFGLVAAGIVGHQAITANSADLEQKEAFDAVCSKYAKDDEEDGE